MQLVFCRTKSESPHSAKDTGPITRFPSECSMGTLDCTPEHSTEAIYLSPLPSYHQDRARLAYNNALLLYQDYSLFSCLELIEKCFQLLNDCSDEAAQDLRVECYLLSISCYYQMRQYDNAISNCQAVLLTHPSNTHAQQLLRLSSANRPQ